MKKVGRWAAALISSFAVALLIQGEVGERGLWASGAPAAGGMPVPTPGVAEADGNFTASPGGPLDPGAQGAPPGQADPFAAAAGQGHFRRPTQAVDLTVYTVDNKLPPGYQLVNIKKLASFPFDGDYAEQTDVFNPPKKLKHPRRTIPPEIQALDGKKVALMGFMLPFDFQRHGTTHFGLLKSQAGCCFGVAPRLNEWIDVHLFADDRVFMDTPVLVLGTLKVAEIREYGNLMGLYSLKGDKIEKAIVPELDDSMTGPIR